MSGFSHSFKCSFITAAPSGHEWHWSSWFLSSVCVCVALISLFFFFLNVPIPCTLLEDYITNDIQLYTYRLTIDFNAALQCSLSLASFLLLEPGCFCIALLCCWLLMLPFWLPELHFAHYVSNVCRLLVNLNVCNSTAIN